MITLFSDETVIVVGKPSGVLTHNSAFAGPREETLVQMLGGGVHAVHRLDRATSGVVAFARSPEAARAWQAAMTTAEKRYLAIVRGILDGKTEVDHPIRDEDGTAREARSTITSLAVNHAEHCSLVEIALHTGRQHQARRHLKHLSHPVAGDTTYGHGKDNARFRTLGITRLALHAHRLEVTHPVDGQRVTFEAPLPVDLSVPLERLFRRSGA